MTATRSLQAPKKRILFCELHPILLATLSETTDRIRQDRERAPKRLKMILTYIERRLLAPELSATLIYSECSIRDRSISTFFRNAIGRSPWRYIEHSRLEVGEKLVRETNASMAWISALLGYSSVKVFSNAFFRMTGSRPVTYRKKHRAPAREILETESGRAGLASVLELKKAMEGRLEPIEVDRLVRRLRNLYPTLDTPATAAGLDPAMRSYYL